MKTFRELIERLSPEEREKSLYGRYKELQNPKPPKQPIDYKKEQKGLPPA